MNITQIDNDSMYGHHDLKGFAKTYEKAARAATNAYAEYVADEKYLLLSDKYRQAGKVEVIL